MNTSHREDLLDSALEDSFPASDPVSVFVESPKPPEPERARDGIAWKRAAAVLPVVLGLAGTGVRFWLVRQERALRMQRVQRVAGLAAATLLVSGALALAATWRARQTPATPEDPDEYPLFV